MPKSNSNKKGKRAVRKEIFRLSAGLACSALDLVVIIGALGGGFLLAGPRGKDLYASQKVKNAFRVADQIINKYQYSRFRQALVRAANKGYVERIDKYQYRLTSAGQQRSTELIPDYKKTTKWDGRLWLITYDINEVHRSKRNILRLELKRLGCGMVQKSVWLSVKDPRRWLTDTINTYHLRGSVIISCLGRDGSLGEEDVVQMVVRVFKLEKIGERYQSWLKSTQKSSAINRLQLAMEYLAILKNDPVIPTGLLPSNWPGEKARKVFESKFQSLLF